MEASMVNVLEFLQDGFEAGLSPNILRRQVAALSSILSWVPLERVPFPSFP